MHAKASFQEEIRTVAVMLSGGGSQVVDDGDFGSLGEISGLSLIKLSEENRLGEGLWMGYLQSPVSPGETSVCFRLLRRGLGS